MATTFGLLHPGAMGAAVGAVLVTRDTTVCWVSEGRSSATRARADAADLVEVATIEVLLERADVLMSICPPESAASVADTVAAAGFTGVYVDANAVAPATSRAMGTRLEAAGATFVDGGIIGPPPRVAGAMRLYLSGPVAPRVAECFEGTIVDARVLGDDYGTASALKMVYASYSKGLSTLLLALRATARAEAVDDALLEEWAISQPDLAALSDLAAAIAGPKGWRWEGEMREIAATYGSAGMPEGFHRAAAEVCAKLDAFKDSDPPPSLDAVLEELRR